MSTTYSFLPWVRQGAAAHVGVDDPLDGTLPGHAALPVRLRLSTRDEVDVPLRLYGPGDVAALDGLQVIRTEPRHRTNNVPPSYFAAVEFDRPDVPWLFTPARAEAQQGRLRPWLCLTVVRKQDGVALRPGAGDTLPVLEIRTPAVAADELPDLSEAWAWAHAQVLHDGNSLESTLAGQPDKTLSRLLCPRRLAPHASYYACIVPTFDVGRKAGLGLPVTEADEAALRPAWGSGPDAPAEIRLPVYYHWEFSTGQQGDFEALARLLQPQALPEGVGARRLHVGDAGVAALPDLGVHAFAGVFRPPSFDGPLLPPRDQMPAAQQQWVDQIAAWLNHPDDAAQGGASDALVTPPIYGRWQQALQRLPDAPGWVRDLNLEARNRLAAGLGVLFVQAHQEELMASAWEQLGALQQVRQLVRQSELAQAVGQAAFTKRLMPLEGRGQVLYQLTAPAHARIRLSAEQTIAGWTEAQRLPHAGTAAAFRRLARPGGPVARRLRAPSTVLARPLSIQHAQPAPETPQALQPYLAPVAKRIDELTKTRERWQSGGARDPEAAGRVATALEGLLPYLERLSVTKKEQRIPPQAFDTEKQKLLLQALHPTATIPRRTAARLRLAAVRQADPSGDGAPPPLEAMMHPAFTQPMYAALRDFMPDMLLSGADRIPDDAVTMLETNPQFIEAFLVGLNHEMARELLWRGFPTDLRGTSFRHFWGATAEANAQRPGDVPALHTWTAARRLGDNMADGHAAGQLVLVIRGELLRRFPDTVIYAVEATPEGGLGTTERPPLQRGTLAADTAFLLFDLTEGEARGDDGAPGWFFVLQQQPTAPRFGLDEQAAVATPKAWTDLAWTHVATRGGYLQMAGSADAVASVEEPGGPAWGFNAAHMAHITLERPFRIALHARRLL